MEKALIQIVANILLTASVILLVAIGFALIHRVVRFFHIAYGITFTAGPYLTFLFHVWFGWPLFISIPIAIAVASLIGGLMEVLIFSPLRFKGISLLGLLLTSLGIYIVLQNLISLSFGDDIKSIRTDPVIEGVSILGARITPIQIITILSSITLVIVLAILLKKTKLGTAIRAVANDIELANITGVTCRKLIIIVFLTGSGLAAVSGIFSALDIDMNPTMGMNALMMGVVVAIIGGMESIIGMALGALLLSSTQHMGAWIIGSQWQDAIAFVILLVFLIFRPQGFLGRKVKKASV